jgi:4-amino-4-deoxy-L-arabinose transferase-like glycosyltransferase
MLADPANADKIHRLALWLVILVALSLRLVRLDFQPLWWDEGWSLYFARTSVGAMLELTAVDIHPPFYYLLLHLWTGVLGPDSYIVRLLSVLVGTATVALIYPTGRVLLGRTGGLLAALLLAISPFHIYYSQEVRMYGLVTLLGLAAFLCALMMEGSGRSKVWWLGYVLTATAALYTQYYAAFLLVALNLWVSARWLKERWPFRSMVPWLSAQVAVALLFLPWVWYAGAKLSSYVRFKVQADQDAPLSAFAYIGRHLAAFNWGHAEGVLADWWWLGLLPLVALLLALGLFFRLGSDRKTIRKGLAVSVLWLFLLLCGFAVNLVFPFNPPRSERLLLLALPYYTFTVAAVLLALWRLRRWWAVLLATLFLALGILSLVFFYGVPRYPDDDYRPVASQVRALALPSDVVVSVHPWQVGYFHAYLPNDVRPTLDLTPREVLPRERQLWMADPELMARDLDALLAEHDRLWFPAHQAMGRILEKRVDAYLVEHSYPVLSEWYGENTLLSLHAAGEPSPEPVSARFGEWLALDGVGLGTGPVQAGWGVVPVDLTWRLLAQVGESYHIGLRLSDGAGRVWANRDSIPAGGREHFSDWPVDKTRLDRHGFLVPAGTPPGDYRLTLRVYRSRDLEVLPVGSEGGSGNEVTLGSVRVVRPDVPPPAEALHLEQPLQAEFGDRLRLLGLSLHSDSRLLRGESVEVDLFWEAMADPAEDLLPRLQLLDGDGISVAERTEKPVAGTYPTAWWRAGELVRDPQALPILATVPAGRYRLVLSLVRAADGSLLELAPGQTSLDLAEVEVRGRESRFSPPSPAHVQPARLGSSVEFLGYDLLHAAYAPGSLLEVTLHWHALDTPDRDYHTFVHLLDAGGNIVAQDDGIPGDGELPTRGWLPSEFLVDHRVLQLPFDLDDGAYHLGVGLYDPATGVRLGERILLDTVVTVQAGGG